MFGKFVLWLCSVVFAFSLGAQSTNPKATDSELEKKVRDHIDVIVDEAAGIADDIATEIQKDERVQQATEFADDVKEIIRNTQEDIQDHFRPKTEEGAEDAEDTAEEEPAAPEAATEAPEETTEVPERSDG